MKKCLANINKIIIVLLICFCSMLMFSSCGDDGTIDAGEYLTSLSKLSGATKIVQVTTVKDGNFLVSESSNEIKSDSGKVEFKARFKTLSELSEDGVYKETQETVYFYENKKYSFVDGAWIVEQGNYSASSQVYKIDKNDIENAVFTKKINSTENKLTATIKDSAISDIFGKDFSATDCTLVINLDNKKRVIAFELLYQDSKGKTVNIKTTYSYQTESVTLPNV